MTPARLCALLALAALPLASGCASPETMSHPGARIAGAFPGLSYVNGDPEAGTTTLVSLPLLSYRSTEEHPGYSSSTTYFLPLLSRFSQTDRYVRLTWDEDEGERAQGPPPDWWDRERLRRGEPRRRRSGPRTRKEAREEGGDEEARPRKRTRRPPPATLAPEDADEETDEDEPQAAPAPAGKDYLVLHLERPAKILKQLPQQQTEWDVLLGLIGHHAERPARVMVRPTSKLLSKAERKRSRVVYEVGPTRDNFRILPLMSYVRDEEGSELMFWPLLFGRGREGDESYLRFFYFLKVPLED